MSKLATALQVMEAKHIKRPFPREPEPGVIHLQPCTREGLSVNVCPYVLTGKYLSDDINYSHSAPGKYYPLTNFQHSTRLFEDNENAWHGLTDGTLYVHCSPVALSEMHDHRYSELFIERYISYYLQSLLHPGLTGSESIVKIQWRINTACQSINLLLTRSHIHTSTTHLRYWVCIEYVTSAQKGPGPVRLGIKSRTVNSYAGTLRVNKSKSRH